jgi:hypothetical protein
MTWPLLPHLYRLSCHWCWEPMRRNVLKTKYALELPNFSTLSRYAPQAHRVSRWTTCASHYALFAAPWLGKTTNGQAFHTKKIFPHWVGAGLAGIGRHAEVQWGTDTFPSADMNDFSIQQHTLPLLHKHGLGPRTLGASTTAAPGFPVHGMLYGYNRRPFFTLTCEFRRFVVLS